MEFFVLSIIKAAIVAFVLLTTLAYLQWVERKVIAHIQVRIGTVPRRSAWAVAASRGRDQAYHQRRSDPAAREQVRFLAGAVSGGDDGADFDFRDPVRRAKSTFSATPPGCSSPTSMSGCCSFSRSARLASMALHWRDGPRTINTRLLGGLRSSAQMISYELPLSLAIASPLLLANTLSLRDIVREQSGSIVHWNILRWPAPQIVSFIVFLIAGFAETNRIPFDLPEAENELVAGFHTEYSSMKFAAFFMAEYANMVTVACMTTILFLGGWQPLFSPAWGSNYVPALVFAGRRARGHLSRLQSRSKAGPDHVAGSGRGISCSSAPCSFFPRLRPR